MLSLPVIPRFGALNSHRVTMSYTAPAEKTLYGPDQVDQWEIGLKDLETRLRGEGKSVWWPGGYLKSWRGMAGNDAFFEGTLFTGDGPDARLSEEELAARVQASWNRDTWGKASDREPIRVGEDLTIPYEARVAVHA